MNTSTRISRTFEFSKGIVTAVYDPESSAEQCVRLDHSCLLDMTLDEVHRFHSWLADFLSTSRQVMQRPRPELPRDFDVTARPNGDFEVSNDPG